MDYSILLLGILIGFAATGILALIDGWRTRRYYNQIIEKQLSNQIDLITELANFKQDVLNEIHKKQSIKIASIKNKLSPYWNLVAMLDDGLSKDDPLIKVEAKKIKSNESKIIDLLDSILEPVNPS